MADSSAPKLEAETFFDSMKAHVTTDADNKEITKKVEYVQHGSKGLQIDLKKGEISKGQFEGGKPDATFSFTDEDFIKIATWFREDESPNCFLKGCNKTEW